MVFKINIGSSDGKTYKLELESEDLIGKSLGETISGTTLVGDLNDYEFLITGTSDKAGFTSMQDVDGIGLKKVLLTYGKGLHKRPKGDKKKGTKPLGLRYRKSIRGKVISPDIIQINLKVTKEGFKKLDKIFPDQNKPKEEKQEIGQSIKE
jgi:small subunit ribosomal protein S6e